MYIFINIWYFGMIFHFIFIMPYSTCKISLLIFICWKCSTVSLYYIFRPFSHRWNFWHKVVNKKFFPSIKKWLCKKKPTGIIAAMNYIKLFWRPTWASILLTPAGQHLHRSLTFCSESTSLPPLGWWQTHSAVLIHVKIWAFEGVKMQ